MTMREPDADSRDGGSYCETAVPPEPGETYLSAEFYLWIPPGVRGPLRGIVMKQHGCRDDGATHVYDLQFQAFARKWSMALMASHLTCDLAAGGKCSDWYDPRGGTGRAFFEALRRLAGEAGRPEIAELPVAYCGHSGGGGWAVFMNKLYPERTLAYVHIKGESIGDVGAIAGRAAANPGLLVIGERDTAERERHIRDYFNLNRRSGARLAMVTAKNTEHEVGHVRYLALAFFDEVFAQRLPVADASADASADPAEPWLGDNKALTIVPGDRFAGDPAQTSWLPGRAFAEQWRRFALDTQKPGGLGGVDAGEPPPAPTGLRVKGTGASGTTLAWEAEIGWQAGLLGFRVYRDGVRIGDVAGQTILYGDYPDEATRTIAFECRDADVRPGAAHTYRVTQVDGAGRESLASAELTVAR